MSNAIVPARFRPAHELKSALAWGLGCVYGIALAWHAPSARLTLSETVQVSAASLAGALAAGCAAWSLWRVFQALRVWRFKLQLAGQGTALLPVARFEAARQQLGSALWLGWGYRWEPRHAQLSHDVLQRGLEDIYPPRWMFRLVGLVHDPRAAKGLPWIHGLDRERDLTVPFAALEGHTAVMAITGAIKTVLARLLVYQLASRGDVVIVLDPKGDRDLAAVCQQVTQSLGQPERFVKFHPAFASDSIRFDALSSWDRETQVASRIRLILGSSQDDNFVAFVWMTITRIVAGMKRIGQRVNIVSLLDCVQSREALEGLCEAVLAQHLREHGVPLPPFTPSREDGRDGSRPSRKPDQDGPGPRLTALVKLYQTALDRSKRPSDVSGLVALLQSNPEWFAKMTVGLTPILTQLSSGDLGPLLSPDYSDVNDTRPVFTSRKLIEGGYVAYFGLDALSDTSVAESLAAVLLADLAGTAGEMYNHPRESDASALRQRKIHVICDEWGDLVCEPIIQLANKARGVGVVLYLFGQTLSDLVVRMGDADKAKRILGNMNNLIVGATSDSDTLEFVTAKFGDTVVRRVNLSQSAGQKSEDVGLEYSANRGTSFREETVALVAPQLLTSLPDLHFFAMVNRAQLFKGRIPVLQLEQVSHA
ncbi:MAG: hypothetical protein RLZZ618_3657 [Pseudomonadota bacterium]|jgi:conjugal transfer pilus assembly protein TraD